MWRRKGRCFRPAATAACIKTTDGGDTWKPILQISENTGITDIDIDPRNPDVMYAAAYQRRRNTSVIVAGGPEAGIFKSTDGGAHWKKARRRPARGRYGPHRAGRFAAEVRRGLRHRFMHRADRKTGFYRSEDAGAHWTHMARLEPAGSRILRRDLRRPVPVRPRLRHGHRRPLTDDGGKTIAHAADSRSTPTTTP